MPDLGGNPLAAGINPAGVHQGPTNAATHVRVEDHPMTTSGAKEGLGEARGIGIVGECCRQCERLAAPIDEWEIGPTIDLVAGDRAAGHRIDRPAKADADGPRVVPLDQFATDGVDLAEDPPCPVVQADRPHGGNR